LTGDLPHEVALELMARADVFVRPTYADGDSLSVREALALGLPVVASDAAPRPSGVTVCRSGDVGDLVAKLSTVLAHPLASPPADAPVDIESLLAAYAPRGAGRARGGGRR
jgi:glycosyltransferase involved in cell wall biosynthesis